MLIIYKLFIIYFDRPALLFTILTSPGFQNHFVLPSVLPSSLAFIAFGASAKVFIVVEKHVLPVRPGRKDPRKAKPQASVSFLYRVA